MLIIAFVFAILRRGCTADFGSGKVTDNRKHFLSGAFWVVASFTVLAPFWGMGWALLAVPIADQNQRFPTMEVFVTVWQQRTNDEK